MSGYTIGEIIVWLLLAAILGIILGWLIRTSKCKRDHGAHEGAAASSTTTTVSSNAAALSGASKVEPAGFAKSAMPLAGGKAPSGEYTIKGNVDSMYYHTPDSRSYGQTIAEVWFKSEADARAAGFSLPGGGGGAAKKSTAKKAPAKAAAKKATAKKATAKKATAKKAVNKAPAKTAARKSTAKEAAAKKAAAKKAPAKKAVTPGRFAGSAKPLSGGRAPSADFTIKGNEDSMIYHTPESPSYSQTIAETWFKTEGAAVAAGFRKPRNA